MKYLLIGFVLFSLSCYSQDGREIIKRYLDTVSNGDVRNWDKIKSVYTEYQSFYSQQAFEQRVDFGNVDKPSFCKSYRVGLEKNRIDSYGDSTFTKWLSTFYFLEDKTVILIGNIPPMIKKSRPPGEFSSQHPPVFISRLVKKSSAVELLGVKEFLNEALLCYEVKITAKGRNYYYYIDVETFLLRYSSTNKEDDRSSMAKFDDYKKIGDFLVPMFNAGIKNGFVFHWARKSKVEFNVDIDPELFVYKGN